MADVVENLKDSVFKARADANIFAIIVGVILIAIGAFLVFTGQPLIGYHHRDHRGGRTPLLGGRGGRRVAGCTPVQPFSLGLGLPVGCQLQQRRYQLAKQPRLLRRQAGPRSPRRPATVLPSGTRKACPRHDPEQGGPHRHRRRSLPSRPRCQPALKDQPHQPPITRQRRPRSRYPRGGDRCRGRQRRRGSRGGPRRPPVRGEGPGPVGGGEPWPASSGPWIGVWNTVWT